MKLYISIAFNHHDSSIAIADGHRVILVLEAERYFRIKKLGCSREQMDRLIKAGLEHIGATVNDVVGWTMTTLNNYYVPEKDRYTSTFEWREAKILGRQRKVLLVNHHFAHACSYYAFKLKDALISSCDGGGDPGERNVFYWAMGNEIKKLPIDTSPMITAKFYDIASQYIYNAHKSEGKLMALAAFGRYRRDYADFLEQGLYLLSNASYEEGFAYLDKKFKKIRYTAKHPTKETKDFAATVQQVFANERLANIQTAVDKFDLSDNLILVGGAALNITLNSLIANIFPNKRVFIPPSCDDSGQALGGLLLYGVIALKKRMKIDLPFVGYGETPAVSNQTLNKVVEYLIGGEIVAWHYGRAEIGPRALGHRSFLAPATSNKIKRTLSETIKSREKYRPVAPMVLESQVKNWFYPPYKSPFMLFSCRARLRAKKTVPGAIHVDGTARIQTINKHDNPVIYAILDRYYKKTGIPIILNTSLNLQGVPLSNTETDSKKLAKSASAPIKLFVNGREIID